MNESERELVDYLTGLKSKTGPDWKIGFMALRTDVPGWCDAGTHE